MLPSGGHCACGRKPSQRHLDVSYSTRVDMPRGRGAEITSRTMVLLREFPMLTVCMHVRID